MLDSLISVIVPVYNVEKYLKKCVDSIINQTYENLEIILVDDGSTDGSSEICDLYKEKDDRIIVVHKKNGGLSSARNAGLDVANGNYIGYVDSDDYISKDMYELLVNAFSDSEVDVAECGVNYIQNDSIEYFNEKNDLLLAGWDATRIHLEGSKENIPRVAVWSKLFKSDFWKDKRFPEGKIHEDYMLTLQALYTAKKVFIKRRGLYFHLVDNKDSIMNSKFGEKDLFLETQYKRRVEYLKAKNEERLKVIAENNLILLMHSLCWRCYIHDMNQYKYYKKWLIENREWINNHSLPKNKSKELNLFYLSPKIYLGLRKIYCKYRKMR